MIKLKPRTIYRIQWHAGKAIWCCTVDNNLIIAGDITKEAAVRTVSELARKLHELHGFKSQLVIHGKNGQIQREYTYGADPSRTKG